MATLTEKQETMKEVLGSTNSIRKFVQDGNISLENLRMYISGLQSVVTSLEEAEEKEAIETAKAELASIREKLALKNFTPERINDILGVSNTSSSSESKKDKTKSDSNTVSVQYKFTWTKEDGTPETKVRATKGPVNDEGMKAYMMEKGYFATKENGEFILDNGVKKTSLQAWVKAENLQPVNKSAIAGAVAAAQGKVIQPVE